MDCGRASKAFQKRLRGWFQGYDAIDGEAARTAMDLETVAAEFSQRSTCFVANPGNAGDAAIALGTFHFFDRLNVAPTPVPIFDREAIKAHDVVIYGGGGNIVPFYKDGIDLIKYAVQLGKQVVVLPHTIFGYDDALVGMARNLRLFCRERASFDNLVKKGFPRDRIALEKDMAFHINLDFLRPFIDRNPCKKSASCLRTDTERHNQAAHPPPDNIDISASWIGDLWTDRLMVENVVGSLAAYLSQFETITSDRLHVSILGGMLNRKVLMHENSYYKNRAVFDFSIRDAFPNVEFVGADRRG